MIKAAIYARSSTTRSPEHSIERQLRLCRERADAMDWSVAGSFLDTASSGGTDGASGSKALLARAGEFDVVVAETLDRDFQAAPLGRLPTGDRRRRRDQRANGPTRRCAEVNAPSPRCVDGTAVGSGRSHPAQGLTAHTSAAAADGAEARERGER